MTVTLALAKQQCRVLHYDEDAIIAQYVTASAAMVEKMSGTLLTRRAVTQEFDLFTTRLPLFWGPDADGVTVAYTDTDDAAQTITDARIVKDWLYAGADGWPAIAENSVVSVTYTAGWATVPADLMSAQLLLVGHWFANREAVTDKPLSEVPLAVDALVQPYRKIFV